MKGIFIDLKTAKILHKAKKNKNKDKIVEWGKNVNKNTMDRL